MSPVASPPEPAATRSRLPAALGIAVAITVCLTVINVAIYYAAGHYKFDLSRPGYEAEREDVTNNAAPETFDTNGPMNKQVVDEFLAEYDANVKTVNAYRNFGDDVLSDQALLLHDQPQ